MSICSQAMAEDERVDLVSFTGSTPVKSQSTLFIDELICKMLQGPLKR